MDIIIIFKHKIIIMVYKFTSAKEVIAKIYSDLDIQEELHRITDIREWITEAIEKIGAFDQYVKKVVSFPVIDYKVKIPSDMKNMIQCAFSFEPNSNMLIPMTMATGSFDCWSVDKYWCKKWDEFGPSILNNGDTMRQLINLVKRMYSIGGPISDNEAKNIILRLSRGRSFNDRHDHHNNHLHHHDDHDINKHHEDMHHKIDTVGYVAIPTLLSMINTNISTDSISGSSPVTSIKPVYSLNGGFINTNIRYGFLTISYQAFNVDNEGFPMIPDIASYKEAVYWYVAMKLKFPEVLKGTMNAQMYIEIKNNWHIYRKQAYGECMMPDTNEMQTIQNQWLRMVPEVDEDMTFFTHSGDRQMIYNQNNTPYRNGINKRF